MTIKQIEQFLEENYEEINLIDFINEQIKQYQADPVVYYGASLINQAHDLTVQVLTEEPTEASNICQIYIDYTEDPEDKLEKAYRHIDPEKSYLTFQDIIALDTDMGWVI